MLTSYGARGSSGRATLLAPTTIAIPAKFLGQHYHKYPGSLALPPLTISTVRSHDYSTSGPTVLIHWAAIETAKGAYNWTNLDAWLSANEAQGWESIFVIQASPDWAVSAAAVGGAAYGGKSNMPPSTLADYGDFAAAVAARYGTRLIYQGWNEPNLSKYYVGTANQLAQMQRLLFQRVRAAAPAAQILSPSFTSVFSGIAGLKAYLAGNDGASGTGALWFDVLAYHFYINDDSRRLHWLWSLRNSIVSAMETAGISVPIWATETGMITPALIDYTPIQQATLMRVYMLSLMALGVQRALHYGYDDGLIGFQGVQGVIDAWQGMVPLLGTTQTCSIYFDENTTYTVSVGNQTAIWAPVP